MLDSYHQFHISIALYHHQGTLEEKSFGIKHLDLIRGSVYALWQQAEDYLKCRTQVATRPGVFG